MAKQLAQQSLVDAGRGKAREPLPLYFSQFAVDIVLLAVWRRRARHCAATAQEERALRCQKAAQGPTLRPDQVRMMRPTARIFLLAV
jgi:hypothetical protein